MSRYDEATLAFPPAGPHRGSDLVNLGKMVRRFAQLTSVLTMFGSLAVAGGSGCGGDGHPQNTSATAMRAPLESVAYHRHCPARNTRHETSPDPRTASMLVPDHPTSALVCRYWGLDDPGHRAASLARAFSTSNTKLLERLTVRLDALPPFPTRPSPSCPADFGRSELIFFHYRATSDDPVRLETGGCRPVSNGRLVKLGLALARGKAHWLDEELLAAGGV
jgi:hypothetical protein